jgi:hypothetical protein
MSSTRTFEVYFDHEEYPHCHAVEVMAASRTEAIALAWDRLAAFYADAPQFQAGFYLDACYEMKEAVKDG